MILDCHRLDRLQRRFRHLYGDRAPHLTERLLALVGRYGVGIAPHRPSSLWNENDVVLITYADSLRGAGEAPLRSLHRFAVERFKGLFSTIHLLPFFPWSSDDGFSVIDYRRVDPACGDWHDIDQLGGEFRLMFDFVLNHCSA